MIIWTMSLAVIFKGPEGLVLAADSRVTLMAGQPMPGGMQMLPVFFDNATKLLSLDRGSLLHLDRSGGADIGIVTYGAGTIGEHEPRTAHSYLPELEQHLRKRPKARGTKGVGVAQPRATTRTRRLTVKQTAAEIGKFFNQQWRKAKMPEGADHLVFLVAGYDEGDPYGRVFEVSVPNAVAPVELNAGGFGISWGGITFYAERLLSGIAPRAIEIATDQLSLTEEQADALVQRWKSELHLPIPYPLLPLQDCVDLATFLVKMTSDVMTWTIGIQGVGGEIDVATITRTNGFEPVQQKTVHPRR
jgi:hypothetical protein